MDEVVFQMFEELKEPFPKDSVNWRVVATSRDKQRALVIAYMDARMVMQRLDEVCGPDNWMAELSFGDEGRVACELSVRCGAKWLKRSGASAFRPGEKGKGMGWNDLTKGAWSEAFKIAASSLGIGRYLYNEKQEWVAYDESRKQITDDALAELGGGGRYDLDHTADDDQTPAPVPTPQPTGPAATPKPPAQEKFERQRAERQAARPAPTAAKGYITDQQKKGLWAENFKQVARKYQVEKVDDIEAAPKGAKFECMDALKLELELDRIEALPAARLPEALALMKAWGDRWEPDADEEQPPMPDEEPMYDIEETPF